MNGNTESAQATRTNIKSTKFPKPFVRGVVAICVMTITLNLVGVDYASTASGAPASCYTIASIYLGEK